MKTVFEFDAACALSKGQRSYQQDAVIADFARGNDIGLAVLADGMGGHAAGDVASKIVVTEVFSELLFRSGGGPCKFEKEVTQTLRLAAMAANACLRDHVQENPDLQGMGATLVATVLVNRHLYWISIGDSPLFLFRNGELSQLNEDHSMAPQLDYMVQTGLLGAEDAKFHPDRNSLTSVLFGEQVARIDCPVVPFELQHGDVLIISSDGLQFLSDAEIAHVLRDYQAAPSAAIADRLMERVEGLGDPDQDNVSFSIVKLTEQAKTSETVGAWQATSKTSRVG